MIEYIACHHFGGIGNDSRAKTQHLTFETIEAAHRTRFNFQSSLGYWSGYNFLLFPTGWKQARAVGEITAAQRGFNDNTISFAFAGNFTAGVEVPLSKQIEDFKFLCGKLFDGRVEAEKAGIKFYQNTLLDLKFSNIKPHRLFPGSLTDCYGFGLNDAWGRELLRPYFIDKISFLNSLVLRLTDMARSTRSSFLKTNFSLGAKPVPCWEANEMDMKDDEYF